MYVLIQQESSLVYNSYAICIVQVLGSRLDVDSMVVHLCGEIDRGHAYLLELAPPRQNHTELVDSPSILLY